MLLAIDRRIGVSGTLVSPAGAAGAGRASVATCRCSPFAATGWARRPTKSSMSFLLIRPPTPDPSMRASSASVMWCSSIRARTAGDKRVRPSPAPARGEGESWVWAAAAVGAAGAGRCVAVADSSITAISVPTVTVVPSLTLISFNTPASGAGTSAFTLSVMTSTRASYFLTWSPGCFSHFEMVPSVIDSPSCGILTDAICRLARLVGGQLLRPGEDPVDVRHEGLLQHVVEGHGRHVRRRQSHERSIQRVEGMLHDDRHHLGGDPSEARVLVDDQDLPRLFGRGDDGGLVDRLEHAWMS